MNGMGDFPVRIYALHHIFHGKCIQYLMKGIAMATCLDSPTTAPAKMLCLNSFQITFSHILAQHIFGENASNICSMPQIPRHNSTPQVLLFVMLRLNFLLNVSAFKN